MKREDFLEIIRATQDEMTRAGLPEFAVLDRYQSEKSPQRDPRALAAAMLKEFDLHLAMLDRSTYVESMRVISREMAPDSDPPNDAVIELDEYSSEVAALPRTSSLSNLRDISDLRMALRELATQIMETPYDEPFEQEK